MHLLVSRQEVPCLIDENEECPGACLSSSAPPEDGRGILRVDVHVESGKVLYRLGAANERAPPLFCPRYRSIEPQTRLG